MIIIKTYKVNKEKNKLILPGITVLKIDMPESEDWSTTDWYNHLVAQKANLRLLLEHETHEKIDTLDNYRFRVFLSGGKNHFKTLFPDKKMEKT